MIRPATLEDIPAILNIVNEAILGTTILYLEEPRTLDEQTEWFRLAIEKNMPVVVAEIDGTVAGFGTYWQFRDLPAYRGSIEHKIYVTNQVHGRGIGRLIMDSLLDRAKADGYQTLIAEIDSENTRSLAFHRKLGFVEMGRLNRVARKFDRWLDLVFLQLPLQV